MLSVGLFLLIILFLGDSSHFPTLLKYPLICDYLLHIMVLYSRDPGFYSEVLTFVLISNWSLADHLNLWRLDFRLLWGSLFRLCPKFVAQISSLVLRHSHYGVSVKRPLGFVKNLKCGEFEPQTLPLQHEEAAKISWLWTECLFPPQVHILKPWSSVGWY